MYFELHNPRFDKKLDQRFTSKVDAELFVEERRIERPNWVRGWLVRARFDDENTTGVVA